MGIAIIYDKDARLDDYRIISKAASREEVLLYETDRIVLWDDPNEINKIFDSPDVVIVRSQSGRDRYLLTKVLESYCCNKIINPSSIQTFSRDKFLMYFKAAQGGIPTPPTAFSLKKARLKEGKIEVELEELYQSLAMIGKKLKPPYVEKPTDATHGSGFRVLKDGAELLHALSTRTTRKSTLFQHFYNSPFEIRSSSMKAPASDPVVIGNIAKVSTSIERIRTLAVADGGIPVGLPIHKSVEKLEKMLYAVFVPNARYAILGNDWMPLEDFEEKYNKKIISLAKKLVGQNKQLVRSRAKLKPLLKESILSPKTELKEKILQAETNHNKLVDSYTKSEAYQSIQSMILEELDKGAKLAIMDMNDNQDFPNVRDLTGKLVEDYYIQLAYEIRIQK